MTGATSSAVVNDHVAGRRAEVAEQIANAAQRRGVGRLVRQRRGRGERRRPRRRGVRHGRRHRSARAAQREDDRRRLDVLVERHGHGRRPQGLPSPPAQDCG